MKGNLKKYDLFSLLILAEDNSEQSLLWLNEQFAYILQNPSHVIVNAYGLTTLSSSTLESFVFFEHELISKNKFLQFIYFPENLKLISPLTKSLKYSDSLAYALAAFSNNEACQKSVGKIHFVKAFIDATIRVLFIQGKTLSRRGKINLKTINREKLSGPISGIISVASDDFPYEIVISFSEICYLKLISVMLGEDQTVITDENRDGATEILNIIYGQAKLVLNQQNASIAPQIPVLHVGLDYPVSDCNIVFIPFDSDYGEFSVEVRSPKEADVKKFFAQ
jgi:CheY-specific phosphatase CheX